MNRRLLRERVAVLEAELLKLGVLVCDEDKWYNIQSVTRGPALAYFHRGVFIVVVLTKDAQGRHKYTFVKADPKTVTYCKSVNYPEVIQYFTDIFNAMELSVGSRIASTHDSIVVAKLMPSNQIVVEGPRIFFEGYLMVDMVNQSNSRVVVNTPTLALGDWIKLAGESKGFCKILENELVSLVNKDPGVEELMRGCKIYKKGTPEWRHLEEFYQNI